MRHNLGSGVLSSSAGSGAEPQEQNGFWKFCVRMQLVFINCLSVSERPQEFKQVNDVVIDC